MTSRTQTISNRAVEAASEPFGDAPVRVELRSQPRLLCGARDLVGAIARRCGFDENTSGQIALAVDEALCNVIRHGYDRRPDGRIWLSVWPLEEPGRDPTGIRIVIEDEAKQVEPERIKGRELEDVRPGGLGVYIMNQIMDCVRHEKRERVGMRLVMVKTHGGK
jgi:anti-sigma regulatory factor (Ser/Thr protein kinase)